MMSPDIRVQVSRDYSQLLLDMAKVFGGADQHEVFFMCACIGFNRSSPAEPPKPEDRFWSRTITPDEWSCYYAMLLSENAMDYSVIADDRDVIKRVERYAHGGLGILLDELLCDHVTGDGGALTIESSPDVRAVLPRLLLQYVLDHAQGQDVVHR